MVPLEVRAESTSITNSPLALVMLSDGVVLLPDALFELLKVVVVSDPVTVNDPASANAPVAANVTVTV